MIWEESSRRVRRISHVHLGADARRLLPLTNEAHVALSTPYQFRRYMWSSCTPCQCPSRFAAVRTSSFEHVAVSRLQGLSKIKLQIAKQKRYRKRLCIAILQFHDSLFRRFASQCKTRTKKSKTIITRRDSNIDTQDENSKKRTQASTKRPIPPPNSHNSWGTVIMLGKRKTPSLPGVELGAGTWVDPAWFDPR